MSFGSRGLGHKDYHATSYEGVETSKVILGYLVFTPAYGGAQVYSLLCDALRDLPSLLESSAWATTAGDISKEDDFWTTTSKMKQARLNLVARALQMQLEAVLVAVVYLWN
eukprot:s547_g4.t1